jgi:hypothetical protein
MDRIRPGLIAGFIGVSISTLTNIVCRVLGLFPEVMDLKYMAEVFVDPTRDPVPAFLLGIVIHLVLGTAIGVVYALLIKSHNALTGVGFMVVNWLLMMVILFPIAHRGFFGLEVGVIMPIATLALNLEYGAIVGPLVQHFSLNVTPAQLHS